MARAKDYRQYLKEMKTRVDERPLLFEQESQTNAKRTARRRYEQILREAGVDSDVVSSLVTEDGNIVNAESEDGDDDDYDDDDEAENTEDLLFDEKEAAVSSLVKDSARSNKNDEVESAKYSETMDETDDVSIEDISEIEDISDDIEYETE